MPDWEDDMVTLILPLVLAKFAVMGDTKGVMGGAQVMVTLPGQSAFSALPEL